VSAFGVKPAVDGEDELLDLVPDCSRQRLERSSPRRLDIVNGRPPTMTLTTRSPDI